MVELLFGWLVRGFLCFFCLMGFVNFGMPASAAEIEGNHLTVSERARFIHDGMFLSEVKKFLGEPDTVLNDEIRTKMGESVYGDDFHDFYWKNDKEDCVPVDVMFSPVSHEVVGVNKGIYCEPGMEGTLFTQPIGDSCEDNELCSNF
jgi:hypothetical protein